MFDALLLVEPPGHLYNPFAPLLHLLKLWIEHHLKPLNDLDRYFPHVLHLLEHHNKLCSNNQLTRSTAALKLIAQHVWPTASNGASQLVFQSSIQPYVQQASIEASRRSRQLPFPPGTSTTASKQLLQQLTRSTEMEKPIVQQLVQPTPSNRAPSTFGLLG